MAEKRNGNDRRGDQDRRQNLNPNYEGPEKRQQPNRRSGRDRRD